MSAGFDIPLYLVKVQTQSFTDENFKKSAKKYLYVEVRLHCSLFEGFITNVKHFPKWEWELFYSSRVSEDISIKI